MKARFVRTGSSKNSLDLGYGEWKRGDRIMVTKPVVSPRTNKVWWPEGLILNYLPPDPSERISHSDLELGDFYAMGWKRLPVIYVMDNFRDHIERYEH